MSVELTVEQRVWELTVNETLIELGISVGYPTYEVATQGEMEAGTEDELRAMSPLRVAQAIAALESGDTVPGGSNTQLQFNDVGIFGGMVGVKWTKATKKLQLGEGSDPIIEEHFGGISQIMADDGSQTGTYVLNFVSYNDHIITASGNLNLQTTGLVAGTGGVIILKVSGAGGYTITLDIASFTTKLNGSDNIDTVTGKKNFISYYYDGTFLYYTNTKEA